MKIRFFVWTSKKHKLQESTTRSPLPESTTERSTTEGHYRRSTTKVHYQVHYGPAPRSPLPRSARSTTEGPIILPVGTEGHYRSLIIFTCRYEGQIPKGLIPMVNQENLRFILSYAVVPTSKDSRAKAILRVR